MYHQCIHYCIYQCILNAPSIHHQCIHCIKCINFVHSVLPFIISTSSVRLSMHHQCINQCIHQCIINAIHQCIINPSIMHHQCFINALSMHSSTNHQSIVSACVHESSMHSSMHLVINISSMHHHCIKMHQFLSLNSFLHLLNSFKLVHLHCCSFIRSFVAVTPSAFLLSILNSLYPSIPIHFSGLHSSVRRSFLYSTIYYYIISVPR